MVIVPAQRCYSRVMESLQDLMSNYNPQEPTEIVAIKRYIAENFNAEAAVGLRGEDLIVTVRSASLANVLRMRSPAIQAMAKTKKKLVFRIG